MSSKRTLRGIVSAKANYGLGLTKLDVNLTPTQSGTPWKDDTVNNAPYVFRSVPMGNREWNKLVGGTVAWNQLEQFNQNTSTTANVVCTNNNDGTFTLNGTSNATGRLEFSTNAVSPPIVSGHKYYGWSNLQNASSNLQYIIIVGGALKTLDNRSYAFYTSTTDSGNIHGAIRFTSGQTINLTVTGGLVDLTQMFGSTIADYVYSLEQATAGSGIEWLKKYNLIDDAYHAYSQGSLESVNVSAHVMRDADNNIIETYPIDSSVTLRGIPKKDADGNLYYDGDEYLPDGTVNRKFAEVDLGSLSWSNYSASPHNRFGSTALASLAKLPTGNELANIRCALYITDNSTNIYNHVTDKTIAIDQDNGRLYVYDTTYGTDANAFKTAMQNGNVKLVYELATPTTESADPFTNPQVCDPDGTEEWTDYGVSQGTRDYAVPVGHESTYAMAYPITGTDSFTVTANDGTTHTYPVSIGTTIYKGTVDVLDASYVSEMTNIASYNGETIGEPWLSSLDEYVSGTTPTNGAQVVYTSTPTEGSVTVTGDPSALSGVTSITSDKGTVAWDALSPLGLHAVITLADPFE